MADLKRFNGNVLPFAINATGLNRTIFGSTTQSNEIDDNLNDNFKLGWEIVNTNEAPTKQDFNAVSYTTSYLVGYLYQQGIAEWNTNQNYYKNSYAVGSDGALYKSQTGDTTTPNAGNDPTTDATNWIKVADFSNKEILEKIEDEVKDEDFNFENAYFSIVLIDRKDTTKKYRLFIDNGNLGIEEV